ncbi:MAG: argininosuccinate synthase [Actinobacteria bacterium]|nr:argininosuccinate synthase [Actinomycetota bacterium]
MSDIVVLAYSGGLDTTIAISWLKERYGMDVIAMVADVGQNEDLSEISLRAKQNGAIESPIVDLKSELVNDFIAPCIKTNAKYEGKYPLVSAISRPLIAKKLVGLAKMNGAKVVAHGCTAKGNDQIRFDVSIMLLAPELKIVAPAREWNMSREEEIDYAVSRGLSLPITKDKPYSIDENIWGRSIECGVLEDPWVEPPQEIFSLSQKKSRKEHDYIELEFESGLPVKVDGNYMDLAGIIRVCNEKAGPYGIGRIDMIEDRVVGIKSREIYECPASTVILAAHAELETLVLPKEVLDYKAGVDRLYADLVYSGKWFSPLKSALDAFIENTQQRVSGDVIIKLQDNSMMVVGRRSPYSIFDMDLATYKHNYQFFDSSSEGFINLFGLQMRQWSKLGGARDE